MRLVMGNKNYSSWSLRPWLLLDANGISFNEVHESLSLEQLTERLMEYSASAKVPVLIDGELAIWDSLAICEYISETFLQGNGWPGDQRQKAIARSICSEMHSGFFALREEMPFNCRARKEVAMTDGLKKDIARIDDIFSQYAEPTTDESIRLFGKFSIADCFYAPVVLRFATYGITLSEKAQAYCESMLAHPSVQRWLEQSKQEAEVIARSEVGEDKAQ